MKSTFFTTLASLITLATAKINITYTTPNPNNAIHPLDQPRVMWDTDQLLDLALSLVKKEADTKHWPLGFSYVESQSDWIRLRLEAGHAEYVFWDIPKGLDSKGEYAFYMQGWDTKADYAMHMLDNGTSEWFSITKAPRPQPTELRRNQLWVA